MFVSSSTNTKVSTYDNPSLVDLTLASHLLVSRVGVVVYKGACILTVVAARGGRARLRLRRPAAQRAVHGRAAAPIKSDS